MRTISTTRYRSAGLSSTLLGVCATLAFANSPLPARAQESGGIAVRPSYRITLERRKSATFREALQAIAAQAPVTIVAEGRPLPRATGKEALGDASAATMDLEDAVRLVATDFDYAVARRGDIFLLTKRYSDPRDLPGVTAEEWRLAIRDLDSLLADLSPQFEALGLRHKPDPVIAGLMTTLTAGQLKQMARGGLKLADLTPDQVEAVRGFVLYNYLQIPLEEIDTVVRQTEWFFRPDSAFTFQSVRDGADAFGLEWMEKRQGSPEPQFIPLSEGVGLTGTLSHAATLRQLGRLPASPPLRRFIASTSGTGAASAAGTIEGTVADVAESLRRRLPAGRRIDIDAPLCPKPITVIGAEHTSLNLLLDGIARVYGLRLIDDPRNARLWLTRRHVRRPDDLGELTMALRSALPDPLVHRAHLDDGDSHNGAASVFGIGADGTSAVQMLSASAEAAIKKSGGERASLAALDDTGQMALATCLFTRCLPRIQNLLLAAPPDYLSHFDALSLTGGVYARDGKPKFKVMMTVSQPGRTPGGIVGNGCGIGDVDYVGDADGSRR